MRINKLIGLGSMFMGILCGSWGFFAHQKINKYAVFTLPQPLLSFFKLNISYIEEHASSPDKIRYINPEEAPHHYLDVEDYEVNIDSIPRKWKDALAKYGVAKLNGSGVLPWHIQRVYYQLVTAFKDKNIPQILKNAAYLGHYIADANVPLHTTNNHNGQLTHQEGIHAFWESTVPEYFFLHYHLFVGKAQYIADPLATAWKIVSESHQKVDSVLKYEKILSDKYATDQKFTFVKKGNSLVKQYAENYAREYQQLLQQMMERQMRKSIIYVGDFWFSAWVDAGQPELNKLALYVPDAQALQEQEMLDKNYRESKIKGREE